MVKETKKFDCERRVDPCVNSTGSLTPLLQLGMKADVHVSTRDEA